MHLAGLPETSGKLPGIELLLQLNSGWRRDVPKDVSTLLLEAVVAEPH